MEKLIELLNEYKPLNKGVHYEYNNGLFIMYDGSGREIGTSIEDEILISKKFGFIKWLVDNDKIDKEKFNYCRDNFFDERYFGYGTHEYIIMMLAIQDEPIEFLISILK